MPDKELILIIVPAALLIWNIITFIIYGLDKRKARRNQWRTSEAALLLCAAFMGGLGAFAGMMVFRHKTKHLKFIIGVPLLVLLNAAVAFGVFLLIK